MNHLWACFTSAGGFLVGQFPYQNASQNCSWSLEVVWRERREQDWKFTGSRLCSCPCNPGLFVNPVTHLQCTKTSRLLQMICDMVHLPHPMPMLLLKNSPGVFIWSSGESEDTIRALDSWVRGCKGTAQRRRQMWRRRMGMEMLLFLWPLYPFTKASFCSTFLCGQGWLPCDSSLYTCY